MLKPPPSVTHWGRVTPIGAAGDTRCLGPKCRLVQGGTAVNGRRCSGGGLLPGGRVPFKKAGRGWRPGCRVRIPAPRPRVRIGRGRLYIVIFVAGGSLPSRFDPLGWHIHEMLFGFVMATIAGFLLTAIANWSGRQPVNCALLVLLAALWLFGRLVCLISAFLPAWLAAAGDLAFPALLAGVVAREIVAGRNWRNLPMIGAVTVLGIANLLMHLEAAGVSVPLGLGCRARPVTRVRVTGTPKAWDKT